MKNKVAKLINGIMELISNQHAEEIEIDVMTSSFLINFYKEQRKYNDSLFERIDDFFEMICYGIHCKDFEYTNICDTCLIFYELKNGPITEIGKELNALMKKEHVLPSDISNYISLKRKNQGIFIDALKDAIEKKDNHYQKTSIRK